MDPVTGLNGERILPVTQYKVQYVRGWNSQEILAKCESKQKLQVKNYLWLLENYANLSGALEHFIKWQITQTFHGILNVTNWLLQKSFSWNYSNNYHEKEIQVKVQYYW